MLVLISVVKSVVVYASVGPPLRLGGDHRGDLYRTRRRPRFVCSAWRYRNPFRLRTDWLGQDIHSQPAAKTSRDGIVGRRSSHTAKDPYHHLRPRWERCFRLAQLERTFPGA